MVYLLDANVFITAKRDWYRFKTFPGFWKLLHGGGTVPHPIGSLVCVRKELVDQKDDLSAWVTTCPPSLFVNESDPKTIAAAAQVSTWANKPGRYTAAAISEFLSRADYWLVAHGLAYGHTVVTHEKPAPTSVKKIKIPDACNELGVTWCTTWQMLEELGVSF